MAEVWLAAHKENARNAAIKVLKPPALNTEDAKNLFLRESKALASLDHKNIVKIYDSCRVGDRALIIMELLPGGTLLERMERGPVEIDEVLGLVIQIAAALDAMHKIDLIHRDLKPANVMLRDATTPVLADFGAVRVLNRTTIYGRDGGVIGTPIYMSPEQITGQTLSGSSDLYALGILFHELLTGRQPFPGVSFEEIAAQHLKAPVPQLPAALAMLQPVLEKILAKQVINRYATGQEFISALRQVFLRDESLRHQINISSSTAAWSPLLRDMGFVLDNAQKIVAIRGQDDFLEKQAMRPNRENPPTQPLKSPLTQPQKHKQSEPDRLSPLVQSTKNFGIGHWVAGMAAVSGITIGSYYAFSRSPFVNPGIEHIPAIPDLYNRNDLVAVPDLYNRNDVVAARGQYNLAVIRLTQFGVTEKRDVRASLASASNIAQQGAKFLGDQNFRSAKISYLAAQLLIRDNAMAQLEELEFGYRLAAEAALKDGQIEKAKSQVSLAKHIRALKVEWVAD